MKDSFLFNSIFSALGVLLLGIVAWIGASVAHLPAIEQKMDDFMYSTTNTLTDHESRLRKGGL